MLAKLGSGLKNIGAFKVEKFITTDGFKFLLPNREWVAFRASGTEPLIRCYIEAKSKANSEEASIRLPRSAGGVKARQIGSNPLQSAWDWLESGLDWQLSVPNS